MMERWVDDMEYNVSTQTTVSSSIQDILNEKRDELLKTGNPLCVQFTLDEVNELADVNALREYKLRHSFPEKYECTEDLFMCAQKILSGEGGYRLLEFCALKNRVLIPPFVQVFSKVFSKLG